jgi:hypothetical protein
MLRNDVSANAYVIYRRKKVGSDFVWWTAAGGCWSNIVTEEYSRGTSVGIAGRFSNRHLCLVKAWWPPLAAICENWATWHSDVSKHTGKYFHLMQQLKLTSWQYLISSVLCSFHFRNVLYLRDSLIVCCDINLRFTRYAIISFLLVNCNLKCIW